MKNNTLLFTLSLAFALIFLPQQLLGQRGWDEMIRDENPNFSEIEKAFNEWWGERPTTDRGYKPAKRWLEHMRGYVNENGIVDRSEEIKYIQEKLRDDLSQHTCRQLVHSGPHQSSCAVRHRSN